MTSCPLNHVTTEIITATTAICPETTGTYTIPQKITCSARDSGCGTPGATKTSALTVTVSPLAPTDRTTQIVPGCTSGAPGPSACVQCAPGGTAAHTTLVVAVPTTKLNGTATAAPKPTKPVTAGAGRMGWASGVVAVVGGALLVVMGL